MRKDQSENKRPQRRKTRLLKNISIKKLEDKVEKNPPKGRVKRERKTAREREKSRGEGGEEEKERDEKYDRQYKRNRQAIYEVYHPMKRSLRTEKNARGDIIKEIVEDNFPDLKTHPNLRVKKVLKY